MLTEAIQLTLFPATMAFAASSDLFTMTIANRISLILLGGFVLLAAMTGMSIHEVALHFGAGGAVLIVCFVMFACGWIGSDSQVWTLRSLLMKTIFSRFVKDESGATAIEYGLIAAGISVAIIAVVQGLGTKLNTTFSSVSTALK